MIWILIVLLVILIGIRCFFEFFYSRRSGLQFTDGTLEIGTAFFTGDQEIQSDCHTIVHSVGNLLCVLADGIGKNALGKSSSYIAVESFEKLYKQYERIDSPPYFFRRAFNLANYEILKTLEGKPGGASVGAILVTPRILQYAVVGNVQLAVFRNGELIPLSEGHTINILAYKAYQKGKLAREKALWALKEKRLWNHVGREGFKEIEIYDVPVKLKPKDHIVLMTKGVYETVAWNLLEDVLSNRHLSAQQMADEIMTNVKQTDRQDRDNSSLIILSVQQIHNKTGVKDEENEL